MNASDLLASAERLANSGIARVEITSTKQIALLIPPGADGKKAHTYTLPPNREDEAESEEATHRGDTDPALGSSRDEEAGDRCEVRQLLQCREEVVPSLRGSDMLGCVYESGMEATSPEVHASSCG